jgi:predicted transcriptional regulator
VPRKKSPHLTEAELKLMHVLWEKEAATVAEVVDAVAKNVKGSPPAYSTVLTTLRILENKGYVKHTKDGRAFVYRPLARRDKATDRAITHLLRRFFENSAELLVLNLLERKKIDDETIQRLRKRIEETKP